MKGKLIVLEGTDGSGKATQAHLLAQHLEREGVSFREIDFPRYGNPFAEPARLYLEGALGKHPGDVNAYAASVLYAVDRFASYKEDWGTAYEAGELILANRYTTSNAVHQASKEPEDKRQEFLRWLYEFEYDRLGLPRPDLTLYLDVPTDFTEQLLRHREQDTHTTADIHERNSAYLASCRRAGRAAAEYYGWTIISCTENGKMRSIEDIHEEIYRHVAACLED